MKRLFVSVAVFLLASLFVSECVWAQKEPDEYTRLIRDQVRAKRLLIGVQTHFISELKEEPTLTESQLRWLVAIEDFITEAEGLYKRAEIEVFISDSNVGVQNPEMRRLAFLESTKTFNAAVTKHEKATRDLETLLTRVELQKKAKGNIKPAPTTTP